MGVDGDIGTIDANREYRVDSIHRIHGRCQEET